MNDVSMLCMTITIIGAGVIGCLIYIVDRLTDIHKALTKEEELEEE